MATRMKTIVKLIGVNKSFGSLEVIQGLNLTIKEGEVVSLIGLSGCGKSTALRFIAGLEQVNGGIIEKGFSRPAFIFQEPRLLPWRTALDNILFVLKDRIPDPAEAERVAMHYLGLMKLERFRDYYPAQLSGGMKQRTSMARALAIKPDLILMDEPFADLDLPLRLMFVNDLQKILKKGSETVIFVTHDIRDALLLSDRIYVLTAEPMQVKEELSIDKGTRLKMNDPQFIDLEEHLIDLLKEENLSKIGEREKLLRLSAIEPQTRVTVKDISGGLEVLKYLKELGIEKGTRLTVIATKAIDLHFGPISLKTDQGKVIISQGWADKIYLKKEGEILPLLRLEAKEKGIIKTIEGGKTVRDWLSLLGIKASGEVEFHKHISDDTLVFKIEDKEIKMGEGEASKILVEERGKLVQANYLEQGESRRIVKAFRGIEFLDKIVGKEIREGQEITLINRRKNFYIPTKQGSYIVAKIGEQLITIGHGVAEKIYVV